MDDRLSFLGRNIDRDGLFVAIGRHEISAEVCGCTVRVFSKVGAPTAGVITAGFWVFDFDDRRAEITQQLRGGWPCKDAA